MSLKSRNYLLLVALLIVLTCSQLEMAVCAEAGSRVLNLPTDRVVLNLWFVTSYGQERLVDPPTGTIIVPAGTKVEAQLLPEAWRNCNFFKALPVDAFDSLTIHDDQSLALVIESIFTHSSSKSLSPRLKCISSLTKLQELKLRDDWVCDRELEQLPVFQDLRNLELTHSNITDDGLRYLQNLSNLRRLDLNSDHRIRGTGFKWLTNLPNLQELLLNGTYYSRSCPIDDAGMAYIGQFTQLKTLDLRGTQITDKGMENLLTLKNLARLDLGGTKISDRSIYTLSKLQNIKVLKLGGTRVTPAALPALKHFTQLQELWLYGLGFSPSELTALMQALPDCQIKY